MDRVQKKVLYVAMVYVIMYHFVFLRYEELFPYGYEVGVIFYDLCFAFIAGYIFYILVDYLPSKDATNKVYSNYVEVKINNILNSYESVYQKMSDAAKGGINIDPCNSEKQYFIREYNNMLFDVQEIDRKKECQYILKILGPFNKSTSFRTKGMLTHEAMTWFEVLRNHHDIANNNILELLAVVPYLDVEDLSHIVELQENSFFKRMINIKEILETTNDLSFMHEELYEYDQIMAYFKRMILK